MKVNRIANEVLGVAADLLPRIKATFIKKPELEDRDYNAIHFDVQRFVCTLRKNEQMDCFVLRKDDEKMMELTIGFTDHEAMQGIIESMQEMMNKMESKTGIKVKVEVLDKSDKSEEK